MTTKTVYLFDENRIFTHPYEAQESPEEPGTYIEPKASTPDVLPPIEENEAAQRNEANTAWTVIPDFSGKTAYDQTTGVSVEIESVGPLPANHALTPPPPTLDQLKSDQIATLSAACAAYIYDGFVSSALGAAYTYPSSDKDQANLSASVVASILPGVATGWTTPFWCADSTGAWAFRDHTAAQIQQAGIDGKNAILAAMAQNATLAAKVAVATTAAKIAAVKWVNP